MASFMLAPGEKLLTCQYDPNHKILTSKLASHLDTCRKNFLANNPALHHAIRICRYNATHHIPARHFAAHEATCPDRSQNVRLEGATAPPPPSTPAGYNEEDWESEGNEHTAGYDPKLKLASDLILRIPKGLTKSERKKYQKQVLEAHQKKQQGEEVEYPDTTGLISEKERIRMIRRRDDDDKPRRGPSSSWGNKI